MKLETLQLNNLNPAEYNPRTITKDEFEGLKTSLKTFGQQENLIVNKDMTIISGHQRYNAMKALGWTEAVCNLVELDKHEEKKLNVIMNSTAISGKYDDLKLSEILEELKLDDDYESLRLNALEPLDLSDVEVEEDEAPEVSSEPAVSKLGEVYQLGRHRVMCGDSTKDADTLFDKATIAFTSPPYNVGKNAVLSFHKKRDNKYETYDDNNEEYYELLEKYNHEALRKCEYSLVNLQILAGNKKDIFTWLYSNVDTFCDIAFWKKKVAQPSMASNVMNSQTEVIFFFGGNGSRAINTGNFRGTISNFVETENASRENENADVHNATMPVVLASHFVTNFTKKGDSVYDAFIGTGTTLIACEQTDRICYGIELDPKYVDVIRKRYWKFTHDGNEEGWEDGTTN